MTAVNFKPLLVVEAILVSLNGRHIAVFITRLIKSHQSLLGDEASYRQRWFHDDVSRDPRGKLRWGVPWIRLWRRVNPLRSKALFLAKTISTFIPRSLQCTCLSRGLSCRLSPSTIIWRLHYSVCLGVIDGWLEPRWLDPIYILISRERVSRW